MKIDTNHIKERIKGTLIESLGIDFYESDDQDTLEATMQITKQHTQIMGVVHGGATIALAETVAGIGSNALCGDGEACLGVQISASHMASGKVGDTYRAIGRIEHKGRMIHVWNVDIYSTLTGKHISAIRITNAVVKKRD